MTNLRRMSTIGAALAMALMLGMIAPAQAQDTTNVEIETYVRASANLLKGIEDFDDSERAAVGALLAVDRAILNYEMLGVRPDERLIVRYHGQLEEFSPVYPEIGRPLIIGTCLDAHISYVSALARCQNEEKPRSEDECHEAWGPGGDAAICMMRALDDLEGKLLRVSERFPVPPLFEN